MTSLTSYGHMAINLANDVVVIVLGMPWPQLTGYRFGLSGIKKGRGCL